MVSESLLNQLFFYPIILLSITSVITFFIRGKIAVKISSILSLISCLLMILISMITLFYGRVFSFVYYASFLTPNIFKDFALFKLSIDQLSAFFVFIIGFIGSMASLFGYKYMEMYSTEHLGFYSMNYSLFLLAMYLAVVVSDVFWFIVFWELMTLFSQFLVSYEKEKWRALWAGYKYFVMTKAGSGFLIAGLILLISITNFKTGFTNIAFILRHTSPINYAILNIAIGFILLGLAVKASLVPLHSWLPDAHPEAPSNVSALLSGVMIKIPVYMTIRLFFYIVGPSLLWGIILSVIATITLFVGTLYALIQTDSKRLLAYHSVGQMGYIVLGLGAAIAFSSINTPALKVFGLIGLFGSLYHLVNHAMFKSLLFLTAGSVIYSTGSRDLNKLGGLHHVLPITAASALIASLSISGIPPFNGFLSKWLLYLSTILSKTPLAICGVIALFISGVTTASFIKYYTSIFGKKTSRIEAKRLRRPSLTMKLSEVILAITCVLFGILPIIPYKLISPILGKLMDTSNIVVKPFYIIITGSSAINLFVFLAIFSVTLLIVYVSGILSKKNKYNIWTCGSLLEEKQIHYPAHSYYQGFKESFKDFYIFCEELYDLITRKIKDALEISIKWILRKTEDPMPMYTFSIIILMIIIIVEMMFH